MALEPKRELQQEAAHSASNMAPQDSSPFTRNEWLGLAIGAWLIAGLLFYLFGLHGPFGRYSLAVLVGAPGYLTYKFFTSKAGGNS